MVVGVELKPALKIEGQLSLLQKKGLIIKDTDEEHLFLRENNYYRLNVYFHLLMDSSDHFPDNLSLLQVKEIYDSDSFLRHQIFSLLEPIEVGIKTKMAYYLGNQYGSSAFYMKEIYKSPWIYDQILNVFWHEISRSEKDPVVAHHYMNYSGYFPIWVIVEYLSFNTISKLFGNLKNDDQKKIAGSFNSINERLFENWIHSLSVCRNICAHFGYLFKRSYAVPIKLGYDKAKFPDQERRLFGIFYAIKKLSNRDLWIRVLKNVYEYFGEERLINWYNFPENHSFLFS